MGISSSVATAQEVIILVILIGRFVIEHNVAIGSHGAVIDVLRNRLPGDYCIQSVTGVHGYSIRGQGRNVSNGKWTGAGFLGVVAKAVGDFDPHPGIVALHGRHSPGMDAIVIGILDDVGVIGTAIQAVPQINTIGQDIGIRGVPGDITGIADVLCFAAIGGGDGKGGINGVVDNRGSGAIAGKRHQPGAKKKQDAE